MPKGGKPMPNKILNLLGGTNHNHKKPRSDKLEPPSKMPSCPGHLNDEAKKEWKRASKILQSIDLLTELDRSIFAAYCEAYSRWSIATAKVKEMGMIYFQNREIDKDTKAVIKTGIPKANPYIKIAKDAFDQMIKTCEVLGMSPSARARLSLDGGKSTKADDKTAAFRQMKHGKKG